MSTPQDPRHGPYPQQPQYPPSGYPPPPPGYPPRGPYAYAPPPRKSWPHRHKILTTLGVIVAFFVVLGVVAAIAGGKTSSNGGGSRQPAAAGAHHAGQAGIGSPVRDGKFQFTITKVTHAKSVGDIAAGLGDTAQGKYTILHVTVTNISGQSQTLDDSAQYIYDSSGRKYDASTSADLDLNSGSNGQNSVFLNDINPGNTVRGEIAFDMPAGVKAATAELHDSVFSGGVTVNLR